MRARPLLGDTGRRPWRTRTYNPTLRVLTLRGTSNCRISEAPKRPKGSPWEIPDPPEEIPGPLNPKSGPSEPWTPEPDIEALVIGIGFWRPIYYS